jgi:hypothetical protein
MILWRDLVLMYLFFSIPLIWEEKWISWMDVSTAKKRRNFFFAIVAIGIWWQYTLAHYFRFEYTMAQLEQVLITVTVMSIIMTIKSMWKCRDM